MKPLILDSARTELEIEVNIFQALKHPSGLLILLHNPEVIKQIHIDNIEAVDVITTSNYQATPELLKREPCTFI